MGIVDEDQICSWVLIILSICYGHGFRALWPVVFEGENSTLNGFMGLESMDILGIAMA